MKSLSLTMLICIALAVAAGIGLWLEFPSWPWWVDLLGALLVGGMATTALLQTEAARPVIDSKTLNSKER